MERMVSLILSFALVLSLAVPAVPASAAEPSEEYYTVNVEYSDSVGQQEKLRVMIRDGHVYADAKMLAERFWYTFDDSDEFAIIRNADTAIGRPLGITQFKYGSTQVTHSVFNSFVDTYEAPFESVRNDEGSWIPLEYSLLLLNSGMMIADDTLLIDIPTKRIIDYFHDVATKTGEYTFDWAKDIGYSDVDVTVMGASSHLVNVFSGLLELDGASWGSMFDILSWSTSSYDRKYGENVALLMCTESDKELQATIDDVSTFVDLLSEDGALGEMLSTSAKRLESNVKSMNDISVKLLQEVKSGNMPLVTYNRSYQALEDALDKQTWFSNTGGSILEGQRRLSEAAGGAFMFLNVATKVMEVVGYAREFQYQDEFSLAALSSYLNTTDDGATALRRMRQSMAEYSDTLSGNVSGYMSKRFAENVSKWATDLDALGEILGMEANIVLLAWNVASNTIPFIKNGLSGADNYELALYSLAFQHDAYTNHVEKCSSVFSHDEVSEDELYELSQYCYVYLKSCYVTREAAVASLDAKSLLSKEQLQPLVDRQNGIDAEIAKILVELKRANRTNEGLVYGFLPSDNEEYLDKYDDSQLVRWVENEGMRSGGQLSLDSDTTYAAYAAKLEECITQYGGPQVVSGEDNWFVSGDGVCLAELVDFDGDGLEELFVAYYNPNNESAEYSWTGHDAGAYVVEVWSYVDRDVRVAYHGQASASQQGLAYCTRAIFGSGSGDAESRTKSWVHYCGYVEGDYVSSLWSISDGSSSLEHKYECLGEFTGDIRILVDGKETDSNEVEWRDTFDADWRSYPLMDFNKDEHVSECIDLTKDTMRKLGMGASGEKGDVSGLDQAIENAAGHSLVWSHTADFDNDGEEEAFGLTGSSYGQSYRGDEAWISAELWYASSTGEAQLVSSIDRIVYVNDVFSDPAGSGYQLISLELSSGGSSSKAQVYGVQHSVPTEIAVAGREVQVQNGRIIIAKSFYKEGGGHMLDWYELLFDQSSFTLAEGDSIGVTELFSLPDV